MKSSKFKKLLCSVLSFVLCFSIVFTTLPPITASATSGTFTGGEICNGYRLKIAYSESEQNHKTNTSKVTATLYLVQDKTYDLYISTRSATITINGTKTTISNIPAIQNTGGVTTKLGSASKTITHTSDGSKSISIAATFNMNATLAGTYYGTMSTSKTVALDKLDRVAPTVTLKTESVTANSIKLTASANANCDSWKYSKDGGSTWVSFGSEGTANTFTISNLKSGTSYSIIAKARRVKNHKTSANSSKVTATTKPGAPGGLEVDPITQTTATLSWNSTTGASSYKAYLGNTLKKSGITAKSYKFTGLTANTEYALGVRATGTSGDGSKSEIECITLPNIPTGLSVTNQTDNSVDLSWDYNNGGGAKTTTFDIYRDNVFLKNVSTTSFTDTEYANTDSSYSVLATTGAGASAKSSAVSVNHIPLSIDLNATNNYSYATITPSFVGGLNRDIDYDSLKWEYGEQNCEYFAESGYTFTDSFAVLQNGVYTVYAKDTSGNEAVGTVAVSGIYTKSTQGAFTQTFTDLSVDSIGLPIAFERTYNSMDTTNNIFGNGWSLNFAKSTHISNDDENVQLVYLPDGTINYFYVSDGAYTGIKTQNKIIADGNKLILTTKDNIKYTYTNNYLTSIEDANGNTVTIELNTENLPVTITDSVGRVYTIAYSDNKITSITDPAGRIFTYVYDENGNLAEQKSANGAIVNKFIYEEDLLTKITDSADNELYVITYNNQKQVLNITDSDESTTYYLYEITANGELAIYESDIETTGKPETLNMYTPYDQIILDSDGFMYEYNSDGTIRKITGQGTDKTIAVYTYDERGNVLSIITNELTADESNPEIIHSKLIEEVTYNYTYYNDTDIIISLIETITTYTYDDSSDETQTETETATETDTENEPEKDTEIITTTYDNKGNLLSENTVHNNDDGKTVTYTYEDNGLVLSETTDGITTEYTYDTNGYVTNIKTIENGVETNSYYSYNIIELVLTQTENGLTETILYDLSGNAIKVTETDGTVTRVNRVIYDSNNQVIQKIGDEQYNVADDGLNPDNNGICSTNVYNNGNVGDRYTYDTKGNVSTYINKADNKTVNTYDSENRLVKTVTYENASTTANGLTTRYVYDTDGNLIQTVYPHQYNAENDNLDVSNGINEYTDNTIGERVTYDENGNVSTYIDSFGKESINTYDSNGNLVKSVSGNEITRYVYNGDNLLQVIYPEDYNSDYDNLVLTTDTIVNEYSNSNVGDRYTYDDDDNITVYTDRFGNTTTYTYDDDGNLTSTTKPDGAVFNFDDESRATAEAYSNGLTRNYTYSSNQTVITGSNGITVTYNINSFGEVTEYKLQNGENNKDYSYTYDSNGNITTISLNGSLQQTFTYNSSNELVRVDDSVVNKTITYDYDYVGNITAVKTYTYTTGTLGTPLSTENYIYNSQNQRTDLSYDANGNLTSLNGYTFGWTNRRLTSAVSEDKNISYTYNSDGIRTSKTIDGTTINYIVDENNNVIEQYNLVNDVETNIIKFVYDSNSTPIYMDYYGTVYYYEKNLQGDIVAILDANGNTVVEYTYDIWGKLIDISGELANTLGVTNPLRYRGYYYDTETGLYYLQSRYYSPDLMRFISQDDPVLSNDQGQPLGSNLYAYCGNEPVMHVDYTGTDAIILQSHESVFNFGHMGLLFQYKNNWYYWYWGLHSTIAPFQYGITALVGLSGTFIATAATRNLTVSAALLSFTVWRTLTKTVYAQYKLVKVGSSSSITSYSTLSTIDKMLKKAKAGYASVFERGLYIKGDFSKAYNYLKAQTVLRAYNLIYNNCMQTCISALYQGKFASNNVKNHLRLLLAKNMIVPKLAYNYLKNYYTSLAWSGRR